jgi:nitrogen fixation protein NifU and related proteins
MADRHALYREVVLAHGRAPRNRGRLAGATHAAEGDNPLCGDRVRVELALEGDRVRDARFEGVGCTVALASASLMTEALKGRSVAEVRALADRMDEICTGRPARAPAGDAVLGPLAAFAGVRHYPARARCATLAWRAMQRALDGFETLAAPG